MLPVKPHLLVISHVLPFPGAAGQQQRVRNKLHALRTCFHVTFLTVATAAQADAWRDKLLAHCDEVVLLPRRMGAGLWAMWPYRLASTLFATTTGLKRSNYLLGQVEFTPERLANALEEQRFDLVLYEYWHAAASTAYFRGRRIPTVLDMHNILWQSYQRQLDARRYLPSVWKRWASARYRKQEEAAWRAFDALIAINAAERDYVKRQAALEGKPLFYAPMGIDLEQWPYSWAPTDPPRLAYYGGLGSPHNQSDALTCYHEIMPRVWERFPRAKLWLIGSNPPDSLMRLAEQDDRVIVTGFVEDVQAVLSTMSLVLCPWQGTYGFRSRLVEVMALGLPVVASPDTVYGMEFVPGDGIHLRNTPKDMAEVATALLTSADRARQESRLARAQVERLYGFEQSYDKLARNLLLFAQSYTQH